MIPTRYIDDQGREVAVVYAPTPSGDYYGAAVRVRSGGWSRERPYRLVLESRPTRAQAQADLDNYAAELGWKAVQE